MSQTEATQLELRKIGNVQVFDLSGVLVGDELDPVIQKIEQTIHKKRLRRVILNLQKVQSLDEIALRKITAVLLRPQRSLIFAPDGSCRDLFSGTHLPGNVKLCKNEEEVANAFGSFLFVKDKAFEVLADEHQPKNGSYGLERRRDKRICVAIPVEMKFKEKDGADFSVKAIATNVSQGGLFAEFLNLDAPDYTKMQEFEGAEISIFVPSNNTFKEPLTALGKIIRFELLKKQYGMAVQFV